MVNEPTEFALLLVDDDRRVISSLKRVFFEDDYRIYTAENGEDALSAVKNIKIDAALIDYKMPDMDGLSLLENIKSVNPGIMVIMLTGHGGVQEAVKAIHLGADDFLEKPFASEGLRARVGQLYRIWQLNEENKVLKSKAESRFGFDQLVGNSTSMLELKQLIAQIGPTDESVTIQGETGTGKELVARAIHYHSRRSAKKFVPVDCAAISEAIMESELFGHVKGAFTGAHVSKLGLIRSADRGTLFLDEIGELSLNIQAKLLRTLQEKEVRPVGSSKSYPVDVRILSATNRTLQDEVKNGGFREDLYYRLNVISIQIAPVRERREDIPLLARYFLKKFSTDFSTVKNVSKEALLYMESYSWPGNVRELENVIRRAVALGAGDSIMPEDFPAGIYPPPTQRGLKDTQITDETLASYERAAIQNALLKSGMNRRAAAKILGIGESTLYRKIKKYGISK